MEKQNNSFCKKLTVIWKRNSSTNGSKLFPEMKEINIDDSIKKVKMSSISEDISRDFKINKNSDECAHKRVKRSLFQENKNDNVYKISTQSKFNADHCRSHNDVKRSDCLSEVSTISCPKSPIILSSREKLMINQDPSFHELKQRLFQTESAKSGVLLPSNLADDTLIIQSSNVVNQINPCTRASFRLKSPEIMSNRRRYIEYNNLNKSSVSNYNEFRMNYECTTQPSNNSNNKSENLNAYLSQVQSNSLHSEDIIESTEIICMPYKKKSKSRRSKNLKIKDYINGKHIIKLQSNEFKKSTKKTNKNIYDGIDVDSLDIINTENILKSPEVKLKIKCVPRKTKKSLMKSQENQNHGVTELFKIDNDIQRHSSDSKDFSKKTIKEDLKTFKYHRSENLNHNMDKRILSSTNLSEINVIPATPERNVSIADKPAIEYSHKTLLNLYVPLIEVDHSPEKQQEKNCHVLIQSVQSPPNLDSTKSPCLFEPVASPTQSFINVDLPFKIDSVDSPGVVDKDDNFLSPEICRKKSNNSPTPNCFDSAKKRKKVCKDGLRWKFRDLINRKKSEACIREYEKNLSKSYNLNQDETTLLHVIEAWKEFRTFVLLCYHMKSETQVQKVMVTLDSCPKNATKNSIIRIYSPWLTIESKTTEMLLFVGVIHAEVIEFSGYTKSLRPTELFTKVNGLMTNVFQSEVLWKCNCSEAATCQCLGELSVYNYLQYMISQ